MASDDGQPSGGDRTGGDNAGTSPAGSQPPEADAPAPPRTATAPRRARRLGFDAVTGASALRTTRGIATSVRRHLAELSPAEMARLLRQRNLQFAVGAALVVLIFAVLKGRDLGTWTWFPEPALPVAQAPDGTTTVRERSDGPRAPQGDDDKRGAGQPAPAPDAATPLPAPAPSLFDLSGVTSPEPVPIERVPMSHVENAEQVEADVATRSVAITSNFSGTEIVVFGAVDNSRQSSPEAGIYDIVVVLEGIHTPLVVRRKSNVGGLWINTESLRYASLPSYYAIASTRPLEDIAEPQVLSQHGIGFEHVRIIPAGGTGASGLSSDEIKDFRDSIIRLKRKDGLYVQKDYGVGFIGKALFRTQIGLPANVPVGPFSARIYLFSEGELLSSFTTNVILQREGLEALLHAFAFNYSLLYGLFAVALAVGAGLAASAIFSRSAH
ncbi:MAG: TIGR02186 family protein [Hyphomicrobiaceae bacterium]|nr:TIGR02186 family protein [Hyphomicrobiaceae bacterium]